MRSQSRLVHPQVGGSSAKGPEDDIAEVAGETEERHKRFLSRDRLPASEAPQGHH